ncbi:4Fe-4S ferredoxin (plasmid) [Halobiforma lacisalsi AJ5]|uniref:4Fe-4S ferredoxin n=2 Tax=Natronobacterium TaxID=2256 RepID=M0LZ29_NATLA|nr:MULTISPECIES: 4Fe-4S dicluster domain-containing protein [Halobiforma]APX00226.1 4Fe-4S ferredoxin [Halobiforma lacisalsi AJ5]EMA37604.1 4Fe-4S ferredoxin iron-sulfur binding domain-containing protein [Halobiforma lacisalsi AJ5]SFB73245.1 prokaryotic molybdopterin-containing oxidoreductase family, iron-sulfur binding subunit [Halobiforma haloterrestris]
MTNYGMVIDLERCIGCHACAVSCSQENNVSLDQQWNRILTEGGDSMDTPEGKYPEDGRDGTLSMNHLPMACQHCENAPCVKVCPVNATYKRDDGIVAIDYDKCMGCRYCMSACPYNARVFNYDEPETLPAEGTGNVEQREQGVVEKCTFCSHRVEEDLDPACTVACPADARIFGDLDDEESTVSRYINKYETDQLLEELETDPNTYYVRGDMTPGRKRHGNELEGTEKKEVGNPDGVATDGGESE